MIAQNLATMTFTGPDEGVIRQALDHLKSKGANIAQNAELHPEQTLVLLYPCDAHVSFPSRFLRVLTKKADRIDSESRRFGLPEELCSRQHVVLIKKAPTKTGCYDGEDLARLQMALEQLTGTAPPKRKRKRLSPSERRQKRREEGYFLC